MEGPSQGLASARLCCSQRSLIVASLPWLSAKAASLYDLGLVASFDFDDMLGHPFDASAVRMLFP